MNLRGIAKDIPDYEAYLTVDELYASTRQLAQGFPGLVTVEVVGTKRQGDPIKMKRCVRNSVTPGISSKPSNPIGFA